MSILSDSFINNYAEEGGAIIYTKRKPLLSSNIFENNIAYYGNDIASYVIRIRLVSLDGQTIVFLNNTRPSLEYQIIEGIFIEFLDEMNQKVNQTNIKG